MLDTFKRATDEALSEIRHEMDVRKTTEVFLFFPMGSQTEHLILHALAKLGVFVLIADPTKVTAADVLALKPKGIIISGGPASVATEPPPFDNEIFFVCLEQRIPLFGICLGFQMWARYIGLRVESGRRQFAVHEASISDHGLFLGCPDTMNVLQSHGDEVIEDVEIRSDGYRPIAMCDGVIAGGAFMDVFVGVQFHPEVTETEYGPQMFDNFCFKICGAQDRFPADDATKQKIEHIRETVGDKKVLLLASGGCDSSVCGYLLKAAELGKGKVRAVYIRGIDRPDDEEFVLQAFGNQEWIDIEIVDASDRFLEALAGVTTMKQKRIAMRGVYKDIAETKAHEFGASFICQGTIRPDIEESGGDGKTGARKAQIKQHHNTNLGLNLPELLPLVDCVKDMVRDIGRTLDMPEDLITRHPFPGPGLVVRVEGEITPAKLAMARALDGIYITELRRANLYHSVWQAGVVVTQSEHTYTKGDDAGVGIVVTYWAVWSVNGFTARAAHLPHEFHDLIQRRFGNEVPGIGACSYRTSHKPFSTIEWG